MASRRHSRAQKRHRKSFKGGRREETKEEKKEEGGMLSGLFGSDEKKTEEPAPAETVAPVETAAPTEEKEEGGLLSGIMGKEVAAPPSGTGKKGKKRRHGKYYTAKQLADACKKRAHSRRSKRFRRNPRNQKMDAYVPTPMPYNVNPYER